MSLRDAVAARRLSERLFGWPHPAISVLVSGDLDETFDDLGALDGVNDDDQDDDVLDAGLDLDALPSTLTVEVLS